MFFLRVNDEDSLWALSHMTDSVEVLLQLGQFTALQKSFLLWHECKLAGLQQTLKFNHFLNALVNRFEVCQHATQPTLVDIRHATLFSKAGDRVLCLLLSADEKDRTTVGDQIANESVGSLDTYESLLKIDDVNIVALSKDEAIHLGVPTTGLVTEVNSGFQQLTHRDDGHGITSWFCG